ncbi:DUF2516 family protein [Citricoccus sp. SGAir0253]|uniref:DUF2516 family protein n=1 Tax=Citricoccus sp. SGAir0253 TaxID=2567881 RepID=UPI0010CD396C|nr:DUF2516 family protein [Citricoccus sp. SGAir0253]QCU78820.1 DUF2516 family protein [Citricoccus sp. SGAir0253]
MNVWALVTSIENWMYVALSVVAVVLEVWALGDCLTRPAQQFERAGQKPKSFWLILTGVAGAVGVLTFLGSINSLGAGFGLFQIAALCVAAVYLAGPRGELKLYGRSGPSHYGY